MPSATRRQLVQNLARLEKVFAMEQRTRAQPQGTIRSYFGVQQGVTVTNTEDTVETDQVDTNTTETM